MSFILPRRLTHFTCSAKTGPLCEPQTLKAQDLDPGPARFCRCLMGSYCCGAGAGAPGTGGIGVGCCGAACVVSEAVFFLLLRRVFSAAVVAVFFFFAFVVAPDNPRGA